MTLIAYVLTKLHTAKDAVRQRSKKAPFRTPFHGQQVNPIQDRHFQGWSRMGGGAKRLPLPKICHTYPTMMKPGAVIPKEDPKNI